MGSFEPEPREITHLWTCRLLVTEQVWKNLYRSYRDFGHYTIIEWFYIDLEDRLEDFPIELISVDTFCWLGFGSEVAEKLYALWSSSEGSRHESVFTFLKKFITNKINRRSDYIAWFELTKNETNKMERREISTVDDHGCIRPRIFQFLRVRGQCPELDELLEQTVNNAGNSRFLFHGTSFSSAENILKLGIDVCRGLERRDFSDGRGFYLTPQFEVAAHWGEFFNPTGFAIIMYKIDDWETMRESYSGMQCDSPDTVWIELIKYFRSGKTTMPRRRRLRTIRDWHYIEGPMSLNAGDIDNWEPATLGSATQLCIKSRDLAKEFHSKGRNVHAVILVEKEDGQEPLASTLWPGQN